MSVPMPELQQAESEAFSKNKGQWPEYDDYQQLNETRHEIRLLKLDKLTAAGCLSCTLHVASLDDKPDYCTLSYYWGAPVPKHKLKEIRIGSSRVLIRPTLEVFLLNLAGNELPTYFWLDVLCIDQKNLAERGQQVALMGDIYKSARKTYVWLGEGNADTDYICEYARADETVKQSFDVQLIEGFAEQLFWRPYWRRMWVVQEFVLSKTVSIMVGSQCIDLEELDEIFKRVTSRASSSQKADGSNEETEQSASIPWSWYLKMSEARQDTSMFKAPLLSLMHRFKDQRCVDERDRMYGLLALTDGIKPPPDYGISPTELYFRMLAILRPPCDTTSFKRHGPRVYDMMHFEKLVRRCVAPKAVELAQCLRSNGECQFSHVCYFAGVVAEVHECGSGREPWPSSDIEVLGSTCHAWIKPTEQLTHESIVQQCDKSPYFKCLDDLRNSVAPSSFAQLHIDDPSEQMTRRKTAEAWHLHVSNEVRSGDLVFSTGVPGFSIIIRDGHVVDIGLRSLLFKDSLGWKQFKPLPPRYVSLPMVYVLSLRDVLLRGIRSCSKSVHIHEANFLSGLFHIDRNVLTLLLIYTCRDSGHASRIDRLCKFLSSYMKETNWHPASAKSMLHATPNTACHDDQEHAFTPLCTYINDAIGLDGIPDVDYIDEFTDSKCSTEDNDNLEIAVRQNWNTVSLSHVRKRGFIPWREWYFRWCSHLGISHVLFTNVVADNQVVGADWEFDAIKPSPSAQEPDIYTTYQVRRGDKAYVYDVDSAGIPMYNPFTLYNLRNCVQIKLDSDFVLTANHYTPPYSSQIDLKAFLCVSASQLQWVRVLLTDANKCFLQSEVPATNYRSAYPGDTGGPTLHEQVIIGVADSNLSEACQKAYVKMSGLNHNYTYVTSDPVPTSVQKEGGPQLHVELKQPDRCQSRYIDLAERIFWMEGYGLRFAFFSRVTPPPELSLVEEEYWEMHVL